MSALFYEIGENLGMLRRITAYRGTAPFDCSTTRRVGGCLLFASVPRNDYRTSYRPCLFEKMLGGAVETLHKR